jgi:hypothetical protein
MRRIATRLLAALDPAPLYTTGIALFSRCNWFILLCAAWRSSEFWRR